MTSAFLALILALRIGAPVAAAPDLPPEILATAAATNDPEVWKGILFDVSGTRLGKDPFPGRGDDLQLADAPRIHLGATRADFQALVERFLAGPCQGDALVSSLFLAIAKRLDIELPPASAERLGATGSPGKKIRDAEILGLSDGWDTRRLSALAGLAKSGDEPWRSLARSAQSQFAADRVEAAEKLLAHPRADVRHDAILRLVRLESFDSAERIVPRLSDESVSVRSAALHAVRTLHVASAEPVLRARALDASEAPHVRQDILRALAQFAIPASRPAFLAALDDPDAGTANAGLVGLARIGDKSAARRIAAFLDRDDGPPRWSVLEALGLLGARETLESVRAFVDSPSVGERRNAIEAVSRLSNLSTDAALFVRLLDDVDARIAGEAWRALLRLGRAEAVARARWFLERDYADHEALWNLSLLLHAKVAPRLRDARLKRDVYAGAIGDVVRALAAETGVEIRIERKLLRRGDRRRVPLAPGERRLSSALLALDPRATAVIADADGSVRLVDESDARAALFSALESR